MRTLSVLVIDDDADFAQSFGDLIRFYGHSVTVASSAEEAVVIASNQPAELVFLDIRMPGKSGLDVYPELREALPGACIVFSTAFIGDVDRRSSSDVLYAELLEKPSGIGRLEQMLRRVAGEFELLLVGEDTATLELCRVLRHRGYHVLTAQNMAKASTLLLSEAGERVTAVVGNDVINGQSLLALDDALDDADMALPIITLNAVGGARSATARPDRVQRLSEQATMSAILDAVDRGAELFVY